LSPYNKDEFKKTLSEVRSLVGEHPEDFASQLQELCQKAGVKKLTIDNLLGRFSKGKQKLESEK
jgi:predicted DNA-binding protein with PD1-like motif